MNGIGVTESGESEKFWCHWKVMYVCIQLNTLVCCKGGLLRLEIWSRSLFRFHGECWNGSPTTVSQLSLSTVRSFTKKVKKNSVALDIVDFGGEGDDKPKKLGALLTSANNR
ncbi:hypothetical protein MKW92_050029, partial [Papaver armeniacum]